MTDRDPDKTQAQSREERLRQALRANLARRKQQARARANAAGTDGTDNKTAPDAGGETGKDS
ncbi:MULTISPECIES: hypothetical protein [Paracoccus]|uniref:hypothetical protein n=1 Tax=Paracoccus TaxID=265 RepID=UPI00086A3814|nr:MULTISPECIES: hypothetical protein [Paracoccus]ODT60949.1 MAG: hypothetical protein ABS73_03680 [Paracoccus sp. SCN 68-21]